MVDATQQAQPIPAEMLDVETFDPALDELLEVDGPVLVELMTEPVRRDYVKPPTPTEKTPGPLAQDWPIVRDSLAKAR